MKRCILFVICGLLCAINAMTQLHVYPDGRVRIGSDWFEDHDIGVINPDTNTKLRILGPEYMGDNACMSFGGQFDKFQKTVMIGEVFRQGSYNSDILWLHGANGFCFTRGLTATDTIFKFDDDNSVFRFEYPVLSEGLLLTSDARLKENVQRVEGALDALSSLNGVSYNFKARKAPVPDSAPACEQEQQTREEFMREYAEMEAKRCSQLHYGFIAQEVEQVLPNLVKTDNEGMLSLDYIGLVPLLVNAVNELRGELQAVRTDNDQLRAQLGIPATNQAPMQRPSGVEELLTECADEVLSQNTPNPFSSDTHIAYCLPKGTQTAMICIYDLQGKQLEQLPVTEMGRGSVTLHGGNLPAGLYIYSLIADGNELASKKMILTK